MKWQQIIKERLTMHDRDLAAKSRVLREQEFTKMREDQVVIRTGELAGRSLADVLMADLMEVAA